MRLLPCMMLASCLPALDLGVSVSVRLAPASITSVQTFDSDADGRLDRLVLHFSAPVDINDPNGADGLPCLTVSGGYSIAPGNFSGAGLTSVTLPLVPGATPDTGATPTVTYFAASGSDIVGLPDSMSLMATDLARPVAQPGALPAVVSTPTVVVTWTFSEAVSALTAGGFTSTNATVTTVVRTGPDSFAATITPTAPGAFSIALGNGAVADPLGNLSRPTASLNGTWFPPAAVDGFTISGATLAGVAKINNVVIVRGTRIRAIDGTWSAAVPLPGPDPKRISIPVELSRLPNMPRTGETVTIDISVPAAGGGG